MISSGAGAAARRSMGTGVFGGMLASTFIATIFVPMFFTWMSRKQGKQAALGDADLSQVEGADSGADKGHS